MSFGCLILIQTRQSAHLMYCGSVDATGKSDDSGLYLCVSVPECGTEWETDSEPEGAERYAGLSTLVSDRG